MRAGWKGMVEGYLTGGRDLRGLVLLLDTRRGVTEGDELLVSWLLREGTPFIPVATKADKLKSGKRKEALLSMQEALGALTGLPPDSIPLIAFSALKGFGRRELWREIEGVLEGAKRGRI